MEEVEDITGYLEGPVIIDGRARIRAVIKGDLIVAPGGVVDLLGHVIGDLIVQDGGNAWIYAGGTVDGTAYNHGGLAIMGEVGSVAGTKRPSIATAGIVRDAKEVE